ncbi:hypothetical protein FE257_010475 [Aspergillus nanangensis]|uniref:Uncharacterized protein n=1 Tax=Aspergillus nanangensis TaxID=2582783 RepID=A0AAD4CIS9_ASPNN|nr:hypothetical protein FE257_010475 [Aspergillus nanangensis]
MSPEGLRDRVYLYEDEDEVGRFLKLYDSSHFRFGDNEGLLFDQTNLKATFSEDYNYSDMITSHEWSWMPLEVILDSYLQMIDKEKVQTISDEQAKLVEKDPSCTVVDQWIIHHYTKTDLERAITAFKRLVDVIESRVPHRDNNSTTTTLNLPWHDPATFSNQALLPTYSFAHKFLKAISDRKVRFQYIAPGVRFPTVSEFQDQPITDFVTSPYRHHGRYPGDCPLRIFQIDNAAEHQNQLPIPHREGFHLDNIAAGFYISSVVVQWPRFRTNGCRLLLPFGIGRPGWTRMSNGEPFRLDLSDLTFEDPKPKDAHGDLYQAGFTDGITNDHPVQIDKVLNNWADRVESGDWQVDQDGVVGGIDKFREADTQAHWRKYWILPSW